MRWGTLYLPWDVEWVAIDGETQLAARFEAATIDPETRKQQVDVKFCYDRPLEWAKQAFHDLNLLSVRPNAATANRHGYARPAYICHSRRRETAILRQVDSSASSRQLKKNDTGICTLSVLRTAIVCFSGGIGGTSIREQAGRSCNGADCRCSEGSTGVFLGTYWQARAENGTAQRCVL